MITLLLTPVLHAQTKVEETSLQIVPGDVGFYATMLRNREQIEKFTGSKAYQKILQNPVVAFAIFTARQQWANPQDENLARFKEELTKPENQQLVALLQEAAGDEIFLYGSKEIAQQVALFNRINNANSMAQLEAAQSGEDPGEVMLENMVEILTDSADELAVPVLVMGGKIADKQAATAQLDRLEKMIQQHVAEDFPQFDGRIQRKKVGAGDYLVMSLDGSMIPWDEIEESSGDAETVQKIKDKLVEKTLAVAIGIHGDYLLLSVGPDTNHLAQLGSGQNLAAQKEFAVLKKNLDKPITSIGYASGEFLDQLANVDQQLDALVNMVRGAMPLSELDDESQQKVVSAVESFVETAKTQIPEQGTVLSYSYLTPRGYEEFGYNWTQQSGFDASQKLSILQHLGERPLIFFAGRGQYRPEQYDQAAQLFQQLYNVGNDIALKQMSEEEREVYEKLRDKLLPLAGRLDTAMRESFVPAFKDSQSALVIDADLRSKQLQSMMPTSNIDLPVPEIALVFGVSDAELVKKGGRELFEIAQAVFDAVREVAPEDAPPIELSSPQVEDVNGAAIYSYSLPDQWGIDAQVAPNAGLSKDVLVLSTAPDTSKRLLGSSKLVTEGVLAGAADKKLAAAAFFDFAGLVDTIVPWVRYGVAVSQDVDVDSVVMPGQDLIEVLKCFQNVTAITYQEEGAWVTHAEYYFKDLE